MNADDELRADRVAQVNMAKAKQVTGASIGLVQERVLLLLDHGNEKAYIAETQGHGKRFVFEYMRGDDCLEQAYADRSDDVIFLERIEHMLRERAIGLQYPAETDHVWLQPDQFVLAPVPDDWKVFADEQSGCQVKRERFYGFGDAGGIAGSFDGYATRQECVAAVVFAHDGEVGTLPEQLGEYATCVLSGEEYINRLQTLDGEGAHFYGKFVG